MILLLPLKENDQSESGIQQSRVIRWGNILSVSMQMEAELVEFQRTVRGVRSHFPHTTVFPRTDK